MKKFILLNVMVLAFPLAIQAKTITPANTLQINSPDGLTSVKDLSVSLNVTCRYRAGIFWPESKSCGSKTTPLKVSANGLVNIPETETFSGLRGNSIDNYDVSISVNEGDQYLAVLAARGKSALNDLGQNRRELNILRFNKAEIGISHDGQDFFGSEASKNDKAYVLFSITASTRANNLENVMVISSMNKHLQGLENRNGYAGKVLLKDMKEITVQKSALAYLGNEENINLNVQFNYSVNDSGVHKKMLEGKVVIPATANALNELGTLEIK